MVFHRRADLVIMAAVGMIVLSGISGCGAKEEPEDTTPDIYTCAGAPASCLRIASGWTLEGTILSQGQTGNGGPDPFVVRLDDGRYRLYYAVSDVPADPDWWGLVSWISDDGLHFTKEAGYRYEDYTLFQHCIVRNTDGTWRMYWLDQKQGQVNGRGYKAIRSALSTDGGGTFTAEAGERLTFSGTGYELNGIGSARAIRLASGEIRLYYAGIGSDHGRTLSAISPNGLDFTREDGVRLDILCPPEAGLNGVSPVIDAAGTFHIFLWGTRCTGNYVNSKDGIFDGTTPDGLTITISNSPFIQGYSKDGTMNTWIHPEDFTVVQTPQGLRLYFILYGPNGPVTETALYSVINTSIK
ncbi:MAG: hypothetical protein H6P95_2062 [Candidatus Aminicenantes bacterium]|nr:hypothetical protein [Candidatus Aminicenantes bacterium]